MGGISVAGVINGCWYLAEDFGTVPQVGHAHHAVPALCRVLVHIFPEGLESGGPCDHGIVHDVHLVGKCS